MRILEPVVRAVGQLSFRNKLRATAVVFGIPLLVAAGLLVFALNARVSELRQERAALTVQLPALELLGHLHLALAAGYGENEGAGDAAAVARLQRQAAQKAADELRRIFDQAAIAAPAGSDERLLGAGAELARRIEAADNEGLERLISGLRTELERINESTGLLIDGDASSSRLLDIVTTHLQGLVETSGRSAQIGAVVLAKKSIRGSRRTDLTLQRGNFDVLVQWSIDGLQKVSRDHPSLGATLGDAGSRINAIFLPIQEAITVKMLDTTDFDMAPAEFISLSARALDETLAIGRTIVADAEGLLAARQSVLEYQRNIVVAVMACVMALILACFVAAYISIMRGLNGLSDAVNTMAAGDLSARVAVLSRDELGDVGAQFNRMAESLAQRTAELREKTNDIHSMLHEMQQGILTIVPGGTIHPEYSSYLETIFGTTQIAGTSAMQLLFGQSTLGANDLDQIEVALAACLGEDRMNFDFNAHLLASQITVTAADGSARYLELAWSPICNENDAIDKILVVVRDVTELRELASEAEHQKHELALIGQILHVGQEKFHDFVDGARTFIAANEALIGAAERATPELVSQLFRNMHTIKGNARTLGFLHLTNVVHEAEQAYDDLRKNAAAAFDRAALLSQLQRVADSVAEYETLNDVKLGRKGPGRRGSADRYFMVAKTDIEQMLAGLNAIDLRAAHPETLAAMLQQVRQDLSLIGTESVAKVLANVIDSLPSLAKELGKEAPIVDIADSGVRLRTQIADLMRNVFMHLYRNALDHGLETAAERVSAGKSPAGHIRLAVDVDAGQLCLRLSDDGRGLALGHLWRKAIEKGLASGETRAADDEIAALIFASGFSTASVLTEVSGRGVGMDAVRGFVQREGGDIALHFLDDRHGADYRAFETVIRLPAKFAVQAQPRQDLCQDPRPAPAAGATPRRLDKLLRLPGKLVTVK